MNNEVIMAFFDPGYHKRLLLEDRTGKLVKNLFNYRFKDAIMRGIFN
jgi:hypothetical protein